MISLKEEVTNCVQQVTLRSVARRTMNLVVWITAVDQQSKEMLSAEARVARIESISIFTLIRTIDVEDIEALYIKGFDVQGNTFSSLEGLRFEWKIENNPATIRFITHKDALYQSTETRLSMGLHSDIMLVKGLHPGMVTVSARCLEPIYISVPKVYVDLYIIRPFQLIPSYLVYVLPSSSFQYNIAKLKTEGGKKKKYYIDLPTTEYEFRIPPQESDASSLAISQKGALWTGERRGEFIIQARDNMLLNNTQEGMVRVVDPEYIQIDIMDIGVGVGVMDSRECEECNKYLNMKLDGIYVESNWNLILEHYYVVIIRVYTRDNNYITLTPTNPIHSILNPTFLQIITKNELGTVIIIKTLVQIMSLKITGKEEKYGLESNEELSILTPVYIEHPTPFVLLPFLAYSPLSTPQIWEMTAKGGSGTYAWSSYNSSIASVTIGGLTTGWRVGRTRLLVLDAKNSLNNATIVVEVAKVGRLLWVEEKVEIGTHQRVIMSVVALDIIGRNFTNCSSIDFTLEVKEEHLFELLDTKYEYRDLVEYTLTHSAPSTSLLPMKYKFMQGLSPTSKVHLEALHLHNNFGICSQSLIHTLSPGLGHLQTTMQPTLIYTPYANIYIHDTMRTIFPSYTHLFSNLSPHKGDSHVVDEVLRNIKEGEYIYILSQGAALTWCVDGGTLQWTDLPLYYYTNTSAACTIDNCPLKLLIREVASDSNGFYGGKVCEGVNVKKWVVQCDYATGNYVESSYMYIIYYIYRLNMTSWNKPSISLLRPRTTSTTIKVQCKIPDSAQLHWAQQTTNPELYKTCIYTINIYSTPEREGQQGL